MPFNPKSLQNLGTNGRGGRPKGCFNKATRWKMQLAAPGMGLAQTPTQILAANMEFFQGKADEFLAALQAELLKGAPLKKLQHLLEEACKFKMRANATAQMLAPYVHPKMEASPQKGEEVQPYVIRAPDMLQSPEAWMHLSPSETIGRFWSLRQPLGCARESLQP
jgi:hypothetical protein